ncbi:hypothetical protein G7068_04580 [Leucobacter viscericola]|uniref:DUF7674 domain-containing protein n=1 Tax=Leucobacter viscericola TaxID=2714935 RepID=A0A6G7XDC5_9MICO|nr:hypothetical protein [Leucobacter viscericola]QIK62565.1 hypothetical protein G7068_04580 [Leucobacter viscericola]
MKSDDYLPPPENKDFCVALVNAVPALGPLMQEHLEDEFGEILSYIFLANVARWAEANAIEHEEDVHQIISELNRGLNEGEGDIPNLVAAGFVEAMSRDTPLLTLVTGSLRAWVDYDFGFSSVQPHLRGR